ncbi:hypothetical protein EV363DRAFT_1586125 [Boletus edulis]|nr:hypothetical protein EV363DRAFT_1586125 [Boletus edulis]
MFARRLNCAARIYRRRVAEFTPAHARLRHRYVPPPIPLRRLHVRTLSYTFIPRLARSLSVPIVVLIIAASGLAYVNYKLKQLCKWIKDSLSNGLGAGTNLIKWASNRVKSVAAQAYYKLKQLYKRIPGWLFNVLDAGTNLIKSASNGIQFVAAQVYAKTPGILSTVQNTTANIINLASDGIKSVPANVPTVKLPEISPPQFLKHLFPSSDATRHDHDSSSQGSRNSRK